MRMCFGEELLARARVLCADDDLGRRNWVRRRLAPLGADLYEVRSGWPLLYSLSEVPFDLVIADARLGRPSGVRVATLAAAAGCKAPFLLFSEAPSADDEGAGEESCLGGTNAVMLGSPSEEHELLAMVYGLLWWRRGTAS
jgi:CheY-like chemotaxis protein